MKLLEALADEEGIGVRRSRWIKGFTWWWEGGDLVNTSDRPVRVARWMFTSENDDWEVVYPEPEWVSFDEAMEALEGGKQVRIQDRKSWWQCDPAGRVIGVLNPNHQLPLYTSMRDYNWEVREAPNA